MSRSHDEMQRPSHDTVLRRTAAGAVVAVSIMVAVILFYAVWTGRKHWHPQEIVRAAERAAGRQGGAGSGRP